METENKLNPRAVEVVIGIRSLRNITLYPLSLGDQLEMKEIIVEAIEGFISSKQQLDSELFAIMLNLFTDNLVRVLKLAMCSESSEEGLLKEITNEQALEIGTIIYQMNFEKVIKNVKGLLKRLSEAKNQQLLSARPSPTSVSSTLATDLSTSSDEVSNSEESPLAS